MDHKGPEHHYDELESPENGRSIFWQQGEIAPDHVNNNGEFHGEGRPYRSQPNPVEDDMDRYRDMPLDGASDDEGGNQFRTDKGILANLNKDEEDLEELDEATEPKGLGDINPVKDNEWASGEITSRPARDEMLGSVRHAGEEKSEDKMWDEVVKDFENATGGEMEDSTEKIAAASWLENDGQDSNIPVEQLGWDIVDVVEPSKELTEAANKYSMPLPKGITDNLHEALIKLNAWVENPEENGKLRPYKDYWSAIRPKVSADSSIQIGVEDPHMADIINDVARTDSLSALSKNQHLADTYRVQNPLGPGPVERIPVSPAERQLDQAVQQQAPTGYTAYPSGHGEPAGTRGPGGRILPRSEQQPAEDQIWNDPNMPNPVPEWEKTLEEDPDAYGTPEEEQKRPSRMPLGLGVLPAAATFLGVEGLRALKKALDPSGMAPDYSMIRNTYTNKTNMTHEAYFQALALPILGALGRAALPAVGRMVGQAMAGKAGGSIAGQAAKSLMPGMAGPVMNATQEVGDISGPDYSMMQPTSKISTYGDHYEHPSSVERNEDPENGKLFPSTRTQTVDGPLGDQEWQRDYMDVNEIGQSSPSTLYNKQEHEKKRLTSSFSDEENNVLEQFVNLLPKLTEFFHSEESGAEDPDIAGLHESLESLFPGYQDLPNTPESDELLIIFTDDNNIKESNAQNAVYCMMPNCGKPISPDLVKQGKPALCEGHASEQSAAGKQGPDASPYSVNKLTEEWTPNINSETQQLTNVLRQFTGSDTQGPHTDEQQAAVAEMLIQQGREDEIPNMLENPADYDNELAEIQNKDPMLGEDPEDVGMSPQEQMEGTGAPGMPGMDGGMPGMPPGPPGPAPGIPDMGAPTPADLNPAGPGAMQPPVMASMLHAAFKYGADNVAGKCPNCDGHTTKMLQQDGVSKCHSCAHEWQDDTFEKADGDSSNSSTTASFYQSLNLDEGPETVMPSPVDTFSEPEEEIEIDDSSHTWTDESGEPLQEGKEYEIYAHDYEIPDVGRVKEIKPDAVVYEIESDGGLRTTIEIDRQEADLNG